MNLDLGEDDALRPRRLGVPPEDGIDISIGDSAEPQPERGRDADTEGPGTHALGPFFYERTRLFVDIRKDLPPANEAACDFAARYFAL